MKSAQEIQIFDAVFYLGPNGLFQGFLYVTNQDKPFAIEVKLAMQQPAEKL